MFGEFETQVGFFPRIRVTRVLREVHCVRVLQPQMLGNLLQVE